jgi:hypothetical protein
MRAAERQLLRLGEYLVRRACRRLPEDVREERYREWAAELPAILHDPQVRPAPRRAVRMLGYAADTLRGTARTSLRARAARHMTAETAFYLPLAVVGLALVASSIHDTVRAPGHGLNYVQLAWELLLVAWPISKLARSAEHTGILIALSGCLAGVVFYFWSAALAPGDWVNYFLGTFFILLGSVALVVLARRRARARRA